MIMDPVGLVTNNLAIGFPDLFLILTVFVLLFFFAIDIRMGIVLTFLFFGLELIIFYQLGMPTTNILLLFLGSFVLLTLSLYIQVAKNNQAVF